MPFEYLQLRATPDIHTAVKTCAEHATFEQQLLDAHIAHAMDSAALVRQYASDDWHRRAATAIRVRLLGEAAKECIEATRNTAFDDSNDLVRGFAWWAVAERWRATSARGELLPLLMNDFRLRFHVQSDVVLRDAVHCWLGGLVYALDSAHWRWRHPNATGSTAAYVTDAAFAGVVRVLMREPSRVLEFLNDASPARRFAAMAYCCALSYAPPLDREQIEVVMQSEPDDAVRAMAVRYYQQRFRGAKSQ